MIYSYDLYTSQLHSPKIYIKSSPPIHHPFIKKSSIQTSLASTSTSSSHFLLEQAMIFELVQFIMLNDTSLNIQELEPISENILEEIFPNFTLLCNYHNINPYHIQVLLVIKVEQYIFVLTPGDHYFNLFSDTNYLIDFAILSIQHIHTRQHLVLWMFHCPE